MHKQVALHRRVVRHIYTESRIYIYVFQCRPLSRSTGALLSNNNTACGSRPKSIKMNVNASNKFIVTAPEMVVLRMFDCIVPVVRGILHGSVLPSYFSSAHSFIDKWTALGAHVLNAESTRALQQHSDR